MASNKVLVNFLSVEDLQTIPNIGPRLASTIVDLREHYGNLTPESLQTMLRHKLPDTVMQELDFTPNRDLVGNTCPPPLGVQTSHTTPLVSKIETEVDGFETLVASAQKQLNDRIDQLTSMLPSVPQHYKSDHVLPRPSVYNQTNAPVPMAHHYMPTPQQLKPQYPVQQRLDLGRLRESDSDEDVQSASGIPRSYSTRQKKVRMHKSSRLPHSKLLSLHRLDSSTDESDTRQAPMIKSEQVKLHSSLPDKDHISQKHAEYPQEVVQASPHGHSVRKGSHALKDIPKSLVYDGKSSWHSFEMKFQQCAQSFGWSTDDCKLCLLHCLSGKALDKCARLLQCSPKMPYRSLLSKLKERFGSEFPASAQAKFADASQEKGECMEDWADRVQELAAEAFRSLPETFTNQQAVDRFCQGLQDREAGHSTFIRKYTTIEESMNNIRLFQHSKSAMSKSKSIHTVVDYDEDIANVYAVQNPSGPALDMSVLKRELQSLREEVKRLGEARPTQPRSRQQRFNRPRGTYGCYICDSNSHLIAECPHKKDFKAFVLNAKGSG
ncbi:uncharacterized protein LOC128229048 [Mya arenaria]|uniref:uncharacterized protein LOC128229048 n=1 Tax=Mya arenaria TaxID=6604 RepID=UPI0022E54426|nr:uncharacterized protein LOC128229048 [Mya arenaria]